MAIDQHISGFFTHASLLVQLVMLLLLIFSLSAWTLIFYRAADLRVYTKQWRDFYADFKTHSNDLGKYYDSIKSQKRIGVYAIFMAGFDELLQYRRAGASSGQCVKAMDRMMQIAESQVLDQLEKHINVLATVGSSSPFIGLFGTVWGIMAAFQALGSVQQATLAMVAPGISEALITTAMGLFAAIPAVIAYNRFTNRIDHLANQYMNFRAECVALIERRLQK